MAQVPRSSRWTHRLRGLYAVTPDLDDTALLVAKVDAAIAGGAQAIQYRNKSASAAQRRKQAAVLSRVCDGRGAIFIVNDDADLAREVGAAGVHIGREDGSVAHVRARGGDAMLIGVSCYDDLERATCLVAEGADYVAFGSFFPSTTKPGARRAGLALLKRARTLGVPVVAIGGITAANAREVIGAGADVLAVSADVFAHDQPADVTRAAAAIAACFDLNSTMARR
jgi:thiamine-phosphate pyrophosphorylase